MNILKKLFGGQKTTEEVRETKEKGFDMVKYLAYFQAYTNTYARVEQLRQMYEEGSILTMFALALGTSIPMVPLPV